MNNNLRMRKIILGNDKTRIDTPNGNRYSWVYLWCGLMTFMYQTFDCIDGKQVRAFWHLYRHVCTQVHRHTYVPCV